MKHLVYLIHGIGFLLGGFAIALITHTAVSYFGMAIIMVPAMLWFAYFIGWFANEVVGDRRR